jgi:outer membrane immunogenic protein
MDRRMAGAFGRLTRCASLFAALSLAPVVARGDDIPMLPQPLSGLGSLPSPLNLLLPNYKTMAPPYLRSGFFASPQLGYQTAQFSGEGGRYFKNAQGFTLGGEAGYNFQVHEFVFGPAADLTYAFMHGDSNGGLLYRDRADIHWFGSARARAGYAFDRFMIYGTGGFAFGQMEIDGPFASNSRTQPGWTAGGGFQYLWSPTTIFQAEYRRVELGSQDFYALPLYQTKVGVSMNLYHAGFYFKF